MWRSIFGEAEATRFRTCSRTTGNLGDVPTARTLSTVPRIEHLALTARGCSKRARTGGKHPSENKDTPFSHNRQSSLCRPCCRPDPFTDALRMVFI